MAMRQPLALGEHFIGYLLSYSALYQRYMVDPLGENFRRFDKVYRRYVSRCYGTGNRYLRQLFELATLGYLSRFGDNKLDEVAVWLFRFAFAPRIINHRMVKEASIPKFLGETQFLEIIFQSHHPEEVLQRLQAYEPTLQDEEDNSLDLGKGVKKVFVDLIQELTQTKGKVINTKQDLKVLYCADTFIRKANP